MLVDSGRGLSKDSIDAIMIEAESSLNNGRISQGIPVEHSPESFEDVKEKQDLRTLTCRGMTLCSADKMQDWR